MKKKIVEDVNLGNWTGEVKQIEFDFCFEDEKSFKFKAGDYEIKAIFIEDKEADLNYYQVFVDDEEKFATVFKYDDLWSCSNHYCSREHEKATVSVAQLVANIL